jgi:thiol-disulfide isomerase/thioredoxin
MLKKYFKRTRHPYFLFILLASVWLLSLGGALAYSQSPPSVQIYFFYAEECQPCQTILQGYLPSLKTMFPTLEIKTFDVGNSAYYEALSKLETRFKRTGNELPVVWIGDHLLSGEMEIMEKLNPLIMEYQVKGSAFLPPIEASPMTQPSEKTFSVDLAYFYQKGCPKCERANVLLNYLTKKYPRLKIREIDINTPDGKRLNETLSNRINLQTEKRLIAPAIFIGNDFLAPEEITEPHVEALIQKYGQGAGVKINGNKSVSPPPPLLPTPEETKKAEESIVERFKSFGVLAILLAGLVEGMNPCALATLIFFISYLTMVGRKRKELLWVGIGFSGAGFATHLLIGLGIFSFIQHISFLPLFSRIVYMITFLFALILGMFSLYDYLQLKRGRPSKMKLQVPNFLKKRIHQIIRTKGNTLEGEQGTQSARLFVVATGIGFIVTFLQSTCTSQVYLPTILFVTNIPSLKKSAVLYLILYNVVYILPLLAIFGIVYWGVTSEQLAFFLQKRASTIKLFTALFFFLLAGILILSLV